MTVAMLLAAIAAFSVNVKDFGAVGDGVHDDTLAIQKAADSLHKDGKLVEGEHYASMRTRYRTDAYIKHGPVRELYFPKGVYKLTGPVLVNNPSYVRGEKDADGKPLAVLKNVTTDKDTLFLYRIYFGCVEGIEFDGGRQQILVMNNNTAGPVIYRDCVFRNASRRSILFNCWTWANTKIDPNAGQWEWFEATPFKISRLPDGRINLEDRDPSEYRTTFSSPLFMIDRCRFYDNAQALDAASDGQFIRDTEINMPASATEPAIKVMGKFVARNLTVNVAKADRTQTAVELGGGIMSIVDSTFFCPGDMTPFHITCQSMSSLLANKYGFKNVTVHGGLAPVFRFKEESFPGIFSIHGLKALSYSGEKVPLFAFEKTPAAGDFDRWYVESCKAGRIQAPFIPKDSRYAFILEGVGAEFDPSVPETVRPYVNVPPKGLYRAETEHFTAYTDREFGEEFCDTGIGSHLNAKPNPEDTARFRKLLDEAAKKAAGKPYTIVLPPRWIEIAGDVELKGKLRIKTQGFSVLTGRDVTKPIFRIAEDADVVFENIFFRRGRNAVATTAKTGLVRFYFCNFYDQWEASIAVDSGEGNAFRVEHTGGDAATSLLYKGDANPMLFDMTQFNPGINHPCDTRNPGVTNSYVHLVNLPAGRLEFHAVLSSPMFFEDIWPMDKIYKETPTKEMIGDYRYLDNYGRFYSYEMRFGGEWGGIIPIYQYGEAAESYVEGGYCYNNCKRHRHNYAGAVADVPSPKMTFLEGTTSNKFTGDSIFCAAPQPDGTFAPAKSVISYFNFPFAVRR